MIRWVNRVLRKPAQFLVVRDELVPADVIIVLGGKAERVHHGVELYQMGYAKKMILTGGCNSSKELALSLGIPAQSVIFEKNANNTFEDAKYAYEIMLANGFASALLVTSPYHSRRAMMMFRRFFDDKIDLRSRPVTRSWFKGTNWWTRREELRAVITEYLKLGLPMVYLVDRSRVLRRLLSKLGLRA